MKSWKRISSLALAAVLSMSILIPAASAAEEPEIVYQGEGYYITRRPVENMYSVFPAWVGEHQTAFKEGLALVYERTIVNTGFGGSEKCQYRFIDKTGATVIQAEEYESVSAFSEGLAVVKKDGKWGYIDKTGALVIPCIYEHANDFSEGLADVTLNGMEGFIDKTGKMVIPIEFSWVENFSDGLAQVRRMDGSIEVIDQNGAVAISNDEVLERFTVPKREANIRPYDYGPIPPYRGPITAISAYSEGLMSTAYLDKETNTWCRGYADKAGEVVLKLPDYQIASYKSGLWWAEFGSGISPFSEGLAEVSRGYLCGYIDKTGKEVIAPQFEGALAFSDGMAAVCTDTGQEKWAFIDRNGKQITPYQYQYRHPEFEAYFNDGLASFTHDKYENGEWVNSLRNCGYIDKTGMSVLDGYMTVFGFNESLAMAKELTDHGDQWYILEKVTTAPTAYAATQSVLVDGTPVELQAYALKDEAGNATNYVKLRDVAQLLDSTAARFEVGYDGTITITTGRTYTPNGSEMSTPFSGNRPYRDSSSAVNVDGTAAALAAIVLTDDAGGGYTYFKLRDLGAALGFNVGWSAEQGIFIETDKPYSE